MDSPGFIFFIVRCFSPLIHFCTVSILSSFMSLYVTCYRPYNKHNTNIHAPVGFEPTIPVSDRTRASAVRGRRLTAWAMARPYA
jgi:hypothetical protein